MARPANGGAIREAASISAAPAPKIIMLRPVIHSLMLPRDPVQLLIEREVVARVGIALLHRSICPVNDLRFAGVPRMRR
jgi:hypothetical protein